MAEGWGGSAGRGRIFSGERRIGQRRTAVSGGVLAGGHACTAFKLAGKMGSLREAAFSGNLLDLGGLVCQKVFGPLDPGLDQIVSGRNMEKLLIVTVKLAFFHAGHLAHLPDRPGLFTGREYGKADFLEGVLQKRGMVFVGKRFKASGCTDEKLF